MSRLIDADALIARAHHEAMGMAEPFKSLFGVLVEWLVDKAPTIEPEPQWIPCSEGLPEMGDYVICSQKNGDVGEGKLLPDGDWMILYESAEYGIRWVTAWMPLPSVYRGEGD